MESNNFKSKGHKGKFDYQLNNEENNPCYKETLMSRKCMEDNNYNQDNCDKYFENYKACKQFWNAVKRHRTIHGITPTMPTLQERIKIKAKYLETGKF